MASHTIPLWSTFDSHFRLLYSSGGYFFTIASKYDERCWTPSTHDQSVLLRVRTIRHRRHILTSQLTSMFPRRPDRETAHISLPLLRTRMLPGAARSLWAVIAYAVLRLYHLTSAAAAAQEMAGPLKRPRTLSEIITTPQLLTTRPLRRRR